MAAEDGWGLELYGLDPWGSIVFPTLPPALVARVDLINYKLIRVQFNNVLTTDDAFYNLANYAITFGGGSLAVRNITKLTGTTTSYILIETDLQVETTEYTVTMNGMHLRDGTVVSASASWIARTTKGQTCIDNMPAIWSKAPNSRIGSMLTAIGMEDDRIGGSRKDFLP